ncbi:MAG TPA: DNA polymerase III subunit beta [Armatimonadota bacterium]|nr:DNA polymerase III subunit beta [Armatimonadota bacterium]
MNFSCSRRDLNEAVQTVARAAATQASLPILNHILLSIGDGRLHLTATNQELYSRTSVAISSAAPLERGASTDGIAVHARTFGEILASLPDGDLEFQTAHEVIVVRQGDIKFSLRGLPPEEFPGMPVVHAPGDDTPGVRIDQKTLRRLLRQTLFATSPDQTRVQYTGVLFDREGSTLRLVSTDGVVRVAVSSASLAPESVIPESGGLSDGTSRESEKSREPEKAINAIVPARAVQELGRILRPESDDPVELRFRSDFAGPTLASFEANGILLVTRLIEGQFVNWRRVIPAGWDERATIKSSDLLGALKRMAIVAADDQNRVQIALSGDALQLTAASTQLGDATEKISALLEGGEMLIALQGRFLAEGIGVLDEEGCRIELTTSLSPCVVKPLDGDSFLYVQSPMHPR